MRGFFGLPIPKYSFSDFFYIFLRFFSLFGIIAVFQFFFYFFTFFFLDWISHKKAESDYNSIYQRNRRKNKDKSSENDA